MVYIEKNKGTYSTFLRMLDGSTCSKSRPLHKSTPASQTSYWVSSCCGTVDCSIFLNSENLLNFPFTILGWEVYQRPILNTELTMWRRKATTKKCQLRRKRIQESRTLKIWDTTSSSWRCQRMYKASQLMKQQKIVNLKTKRKAIE